MVPRQLQRRGCKLCQTTTTTSQTTPTLSFVDISSSSSLLPTTSHNATSPVPYSSLPPPLLPPSSSLRKKLASHRITRRNLPRFELLTPASHASSSLISSLSGGGGGNGDHRTFQGHLLSLSPPQPSSSGSLFSAAPPTFTTEPYGSVRLSNLYGGIVPCGVAFGGGSGPLEKIYWEVRDARTSAASSSSFSSDGFSPASDIPGLRETRADGSLAFYPFSGEGALQAAELHNAHYRCVAVTAAGRLASRSILVTLVYEKPSIVVRSYDATVSEGNDALLKCSVSSELYEVVAWHTDDGEIFLPFGASTT
ncbi:hypothetical protein TYRP_003926, partial [Tyrophagus putrescentiae]